MKRLLFLESLPTISGGQRVFLTLAEWLKGKYEVIALLPGEGPLSQKLREVGVRYCTAPVGEYSLVRKNLRDVANYSLRFPYLTWATLRLIKNEGIGLLYANSARTYMWGSLAAQLAGKPVIWHVHHMMADAQGLALLNVFGRLSAVRRLICVCDAAKAQYPALQQKGITIYNGIDTKRFKPSPDLGLEFRQEMGIPASSQVMGIIGDLTPHKGQHVFLRAAKAVAETRDDVVFVIVGEERPNKEGLDYKMQLQDMARNFPAGARVIFTGRRDDMPRVMNGLDILVVASLSSETTSLVLQEAMSCGKVVVSSRVGGVPELLKHGVNGYLYPLGDDEALAETLLSLVQAPVRLTEMGQQARETAQTQFDQRASLAAIEREIEAVLEF